MQLKRIIEETDTRAGRAFDFVIQALIVLSIVTFSIETLPDLSPKATSALGMLEAVLVGIFTLEYILRLVVADRKLGFVFSFYGLIDLAAILPFYLTGGLVDLRALRGFRLLRVFRLFKLLRYSQAMRRVRRAIILAKEELVLFFVIALIVLYLAGVGIYYFERTAQPDDFASIFHSLWWAVASLTTVGYGDVTPITVGGRIFTFLILTVGLGIVAAPAGILATALSQARTEEEREDAQKSASDSRESAATGGTSIPSGE